MPHFFGRTRPILKQKSLKLGLIGFCMGLADLVPGVSGGTIAFIFGIYEELLFSIKTVTGKAAWLLLRGKVKEALKAIPFRFLIPLVSGLVLALFSLANLLNWLLTHQAILVWAFFFGLVVASIRIVARRVVNWDAHDIVAFVLASIGAYFLVGLTPIQTSDSLGMYFISGAIAICAMILPGISGSFILVLMGKYSQVLGAVTERNITVLLVFAAGTVAGLSFFSRFLNWLFTRHHDISIAVLSGFMLGSLRKIWPWQETVQDQTINIFPRTLNAETLLVILLMLIGLFIMLYLDKLHALAERTGDINNKEFAAVHRSALEEQKHIAK